MYACALARVLARVGGFVSVCRDEKIYFIHVRMSAGAIIITSHASLFPKIGNCSGIDGAAEVFLL